MKNYQKLYFKHYYAILNDGTRVEVTRRECFAYPEPPTADNPYPQCFYYSPDGDCAIRLPRTAESVELARFNRADLKQEERYQINKANRGYISLDQTIDTDNGEDEVSGLDLEDPDADFQDRAALRHDILAVLDTLDPINRRICELIMEDDSYTNVYIAAQLGITEGAVRKRRKAFAEIFAEFRP